MAREGAMAPKRITDAGLAKVMGKRGGNLILGPASGSIEDFLRNAPKKKKIQTGAGDVPVSSKASPSMAPPSAQAASSSLSPVTSSSQVVPCSSTPFIAAALMHGHRHG